MMSFNYFVSKRINHHSEYKLLLEDSSKTFTHEAFEIFHFGEKLYKMIEGKTPYGIVHNFVPEGKSVKVTKKTNEQIETLINKMINSTSARAEVFSELLVELNQF